MKPIKRVEGVTTSGYLFVEFQTVIDKLQTNYLAQRAGMYWNVFKVPVGAETGLRTLGTFPSKDEAVDYASKEAIKANISYF